MHIDEKCSILPRVATNTTLHPMNLTHIGLVKAKKYCEAKKNIGKIMFICAVCRCVLAEHGEVLFDGKGDSN